MLAVVLQEQMGSSAQERLQTENEKAILAHYSREGLERHLRGAEWGKTPVSLKTGLDLTVKAWEGNGKWH